MRRTARAFLAGAILLSGCSRDGGVIAKINAPSVGGIFVIEDDYRSTALTAVQHSVFYEAHGKRKLIFEGVGSDAPKLSFLRPGLLLIAYCGGNIQEVESSFSDHVDYDAADWKIIRVQVVTEPGLKFSARKIC